MNQVIFLSAQLYARNTIPATAAAAANFQHLASSSNHHLDHNLTATSNVKHTMKVCNERM